MILRATHAWIWWASQSPKLSTAAQQAIANQSQSGVAVISCWAVPLASRPNPAALLVGKGRLKLDRDVG